MTAVPFVKRARVARNVVVLTGAGVSVASGLKPYRGPGGFWTTNPELASRLVAGVDAETLWTVTCDWRKELVNAEPNAAHCALPDHDPSGARVERRAIQLGIRGETLLRFTNDWILAIEDISDMVVAQRGRPPSDLVIPRERVYLPPSEALQGLGMMQDSNSIAAEGIDA